jgi:hypothetical protein
MLILLIILLAAGTAAWIVVCRQPGRNPIRDVRRWHTSRDALRQLAQAPVPGGALDADPDDGRALDDQYGDMTVGSNVRRVADPRRERAARPEAHSGRRLH